MKYRVIGLALSLVATCLVWSGTALGLTIDLVAEPATVTMPDATVVDMWGFRDTNDGTHVSGAWEVPVFSTDETDTLTINLTNNLPADGTSSLKKPVSVVIPGLLGTEVGANEPVWIDGATGTIGIPSVSRPGAAARVRSLTHETANGGSLGVYEWANLSPGTYIIQSGTHQAVQVQMGLYAVLVVTPSTPGIAYNPSATVTAGQLGYTTEQVLVFSEVDVDLHTAIAGTGPDGEDYGPGETYTSTMDYHPDYYLVNGMPYSDGQAPISIGSSTDNVLIRLVNAGYETYVPLFQGEYVNLIAEDGNLLPYVHEQYAVELAAGKTKDVILETPSLPSIAVYDSRLALTNAGASNGGMLVEFAVDYGQLAVLSPNGGETLYGGFDTQIYWAPFPGADNYAVRYSLDNGATWGWIAGGVTENSVVWSVPAQATTEGLVRVNARDAGNGFLGLDVSNANFAITVPVVTIVAPNGGEILAGGLPTTISWDAMPGADNYVVRTSLDNGATWTIVANGVTGTSVVWNVPNESTSLGLVRINARDASNSLLDIDVSDAVFSISAGLNIISPNGGEVLTGGTSTEISWVSQPGASHYNVRYSLDDGTTWNWVAGNVVGTSLPWTVPNTATTEGLVRINAVDGSGGPTVIDVSDAVFTIILP